MPDAKHEILSERETVAACRAAVDNLMLVAKSATVMADSLLDDGDQRRRYELMRRAFISEMVRLVHETDALLGAALYSQLEASKDAETSASVARKPLKELS